MDDFIRTFLSISLSGAILICFILLLKPFYQARISRRWQYYIWLLVILRLLLPVTTNFGTDWLSVPTFHGMQVLELRPDSAGKYAGNGQETEEGSGSIDDEEQKSGDNAQPFNTIGQENGFLKRIDSAIPPYSGAFSLGSYLIFAWLTAALILILHKVWVYYGFIRYLKAGNQQISDIAVLNLLGERKEELKIKRKIELYCNSNISSPVMTGFLHPAIIIPKENIETIKMSYIFRHELVHYKRGDLLYKWLTQMTICLHWFNPFVYLIGKEVNQACELACDEVIIKSLDESEKRTYGDTLLSFLKSKESYGRSLASVTLSEGARQMKERLGAIMDYQKKSKRIKAVTCMLTLGICIFGVTISAWAAPVKAREAEREEEKEAETEAAEEAAADKADSQKGIQLGNGKTYFTYVHNGYYQNSYVIEMGYNLPEKELYKYPEQAGITLEDGTEMTVYFEEAAKEYSNEKEALKAITDLIDRVRYKRERKELIVERPYIVSMEYVPLEEVNTYAEKCYQGSEENLAKFTAIFPELDEKLKSDYYERIYQNEEIAFFSCLIPDMDQETVNNYVDRAKADDKIAFYSVGLQYVSQNRLAEYLKKAYEEDDIAQFSVAMSYLSDAGRQDWLEKARRDEKITFIAVLEDYD